MVITDPSGKVIEASNSMSYLGATIASDALMDTEVNRRIGRAKADSSKMSKLWKHSSLPSSKKIGIFEAVIVSTLLYGLSAS